MSVSPLGIDVSVQGDMVSAVLDDLERLLGMHSTRAIGLMGRHVRLPIPRTSGP